MPIPDYQSLMLPLLEFAGDKKEHSIQETIDHLSKLFDLSKSEKRELLPSGQQAIIDNRVGWARTYLKKAGLLESTKRGSYKITEKGLDVLKENPSKIDVKYLEKFPDFVEFRTMKKDEIVSEKEDEYLTEKTPQELIEIGYKKFRSELTQKLRKEIQSCSPDFFEKIVIDILLQMGYGGSRKDAGEALGRTGDEGIDGIIKEDKLGLEVIYIQAKRWKGTVGRPEIHKFVGALQGQRAKKGIFITNSNFSKDAIEYVKTIEPKIVLIDGEQLAQLMIDNEVGVSKLNTYDIKTIDADYFTEE